MHAEQYYRVAALPAKKSNTPQAVYLEPEEVRAILKQPDRRTALGVRDFALLMFLYNTGARVSEAIAVRAVELNLTGPFQALLHGKGGKDRICPLWRDTAEAIKQMVNVQAIGPGVSLFHNARGDPITRDGIAYILSKYVKAAAAEMPRLRSRSITPHVLRHSCAVALLQADVDITVIRDYLGHATVSTTNRYVSTNLRMKRDVLEVFWKRSGLSTSRSAPWRPKPGLLAFLESL
jgi:site-specific recombinase XerD